MHAVPFDMLACLEGCAQLHVTVRQLGSDPSRSLVCVCVCVRFILHCQSFGSDVCVCVCWISEFGVLKQASDLHSVCVCVCVFTFKVLCV